MARTRFIGSFVRLHVPPPSTHRLVDLRQQLQSAFAAAVASAGEHRALLAAGDANGLAYFTMPYEGRHDVPRTELIADSLRWLDTYLGPVR